MASQIISLGRDPNEPKIFHDDWNQAVFPTIRNALLKLALAETDSRHFLQQALALISHHLETQVLFVNNETLEIPFPAKRFDVMVQESIVGTLLIAQQDFLARHMPPDSLQELAEIVGISLISLRQLEELSDLENESEEMLQYAPDVILVTYGDGIIKMANHKAHDLVGAPNGALVGKSVLSVLNYSTLTMDGVLEYGQSGEKLEAEFLGPSGRRLASFGISLVGQDNGEQQVLMVGRDVTSERQAELALRRTGRATLMAQTIDYLLHEVNNPLGALLSTVSTVMRKTDRVKKMLNSVSGLDEIVSQLQQVDTFLQNAKKSGVRINKAMKVLRSANHKRTLCGPRAVDVSFELGLAISSMEQEHVKIRVIKSIENMPSMEVPPLHLAEIFGAVFKNAAEALESVAREPKQIMVTGGVRDQALIITIEDNGPGVPTEYYEKIFMPFFTTKPLGSAIGLGLAMAADMAKRIGGSIEVYPSTIMAGACFQLRFPISK